MFNTLMFTTLLACGAWQLCAEVSVTHEPPRTTGQKATVRLEIVNRLDATIESAKAACFVSDENGQVVAQGSRWVIGGHTNSPSLAVGATNQFHFVVTARQPFASTNLTAKVVFSVVNLSSGRAVNTSKEVVVQPVATNKEP